MTQRLGFACKFIHHPHQVTGIGALDECKKYNTSGTTVAWLKRQTRDTAELKLWELMKHNIEAVRLLVSKVAQQQPELKMVRLSSDILTCYTEPTWRYFWQQPDVRRYAEQHFAEVGRIARDNDVRISFHPGQFVVLGSDNPDVVTRSIEEFEYHADMARWMGYGQKFQDIKINVHISGRAGAQGVRAAYQRLSPEARNAITIENEEITWGLDSCLELSDVLPIVLDVHHAWIHEGAYIELDDARIARILDSWRGVRPVMHYSVSREDLLVGHPRDQRPDFGQLLAQGFKKSKLRAHSDFYWNEACNRWVQGFRKHFDVMCESKSKNLGVQRLHESWSTSACL
jgi:UV DNA damage endonuclease